MSLWLRFAVQTADTSSSMQYARDHALMTFDQNLRGQCLTSLSTRTRGRASRRPSSRRLALFVRRQSRQRPVTAQERIASADAKRLHAPDYELITPAGNVFSRTQYIEAI